MQAIKIAELHDKSNIKILCQEWVKCRANAKKIETRLFSSNTVLSETGSKNTTCATGCRRS